MFVSRSSAQLGRCRVASGRRAPNPGFRPVARPLSVARAVQAASAADVIDASILEAAGDPAISSLAQQILEAEQELKGLFEPGRPMPSAGSVAKKRQAVSDMKELLAAKLHGQDTAVNPDASDGEAERARKLFLEVERSLQRQQRSEEPAPAAGQFNFELALLEAENERLRETAEALLTRQQMLEELAEAQGLIVYENGVLVWTTKAGGTAEPGAAPRGKAAGQQGGAFFDQLEMAVASTMR